ncbi:MAG: ABC transporter permease [Lachnospiraceae bacterium]|nr:ABC transporter permease [Lachnospiraceae bacterium]
MGLISAICSELAKLKHTSFWKVHIIMPVAGAFIFVLYFMLYDSVDDMKKLKLILEITATMFPLLIGLIVSLNVLQEERASHFQTLLAVPRRGRIFLAKLVVLYGSGTAALGCLYALFLLGLGLTGQFEEINICLLVQAMIGIALGNLIIYVLHLFLSLKFGFGVSLFWGIFESLQIIMYSNIELKGAARYIPFAWSISWGHDVLNQTLGRNGVEWVLSMLLTVCALLAAIKWFIHWEGRKNYE